MSGVRVTYAGLISFGIVMITVITGLIFTLIVTRRLEVDEFAAWSLIGSLIVYVMILDPISSYWATRQIARGEKVAVTAIGTNIIFAIIATGIYQLIIYYIAITTDVNYDVLLLSSLMIPLLYLGKEMKAILHAFKPQSTSYGFLIFETVKIPVGLIFVYWLDLGLIGAIYTTILSQLSSVIFYTYSIRSKLKEKFDFNYVKPWLKNFWLPLLQGNTDRFIHLDVLIYTSIVGSVSGLAYLGASKAIINAVSMTTYLSNGLYPKLVFGQKDEYVVMMFKRTLLFTIPIVGMALVFAKPGLWILNPNYFESYIIVYAWVFINFSYVIQSLFVSSLLGLETVDVQKDPKIKQFLKSKLFKVPMMDVSGRIFYIIALLLFLPFIFQSSSSDFEVIFWWGIIGVGANALIIGLYWNMMNKSNPFKFPIKNVVKYVLVTILASILSLILIDNYLIYEESIFKFLPMIIPFVLLYASIYTSLIYLWDKETRHLLKLIINEIKK